MGQYLKSNDVMPELLFHGGIVADDQNIWLILTGFNVLMQIERRTGKITLCEVISEYNHTMNKVAYRFLFKHENKLILLPYNEKDICIYDINENKFEHIELDMTYINEENAWKFSGYEKIGDKVIVYGVYSLILIIHLPTFEIVYLDLKKKLPKDLGAELWFWEYSYSQNNKLFLVPLKYPCIIELDICSNDIQYYEIPEKKDAYMDNPVFNGSSLYYINRKEEGMVKLTRYDLESGKIESYGLGIEKIGSYRTFSFISCVNNVLWMLPGACGEGRKFYISEKRVEKIDELPVIPERKLRIKFPYRFNYNNGFLDENGHIIAIHAWTRQLIDIDAVEGKIKAIPIHKSDRMRWSDLFDEIYRDSYCGMHTEWMDWMLEVYLNKIVTAGHSENSDLKGMIGTNIYKSIKSI